MAARFKDRTNDFRAAVELQISRQLAADDSAGTSARRPLLNGADSSAAGTSTSGAQAEPSTGPKAARAEFARRAGAIGREIGQTTAKLEKLAQLAKRKSLFDDRPVEISELTYIIKQDIANLNQSIAGLQGFTNSNFPGAGGAAGKAGDKQVAEHNKNVLVMLQSKLADTSIGFKDILEIRTQNMKASRDRTEQFSYAGSSQASSAHDSPLFRAANSHAGKGKGREDAGPNGAMSGGVGSRPGSTGPGGGTSYKQHGGAGGNSDFLALDMGAAEKGIGGGQSNGGGDFMQMQLVEQQDSYIQQRGTAIESIEGTIAELGQIFSQLATMVAQQGEQVTRIDADVEEISTNVSGAQRELLKYFASVSSNRALMLKIMGVLVAFFLLFVLVS